MSNLMVRQVAFTTGEADVNVWKRTDIDSYLSAAQSLLNMQVGITGLCKKRSGSRFSDDAADYYDANSQAYEFVDKNQNYYLILSNATAGDLTWSAFKVDPVTNDVSWYQDIFLIDDGTTPLPYASDQLRDIDYGLDNDALVLTHGSYKTARIYISDYTDPDNPVFSWQYLNIFPLPAYDFNNINYNEYGAVFTSDATNFTLILSGGGGLGFDSSWEGGQIVSSGSTADSPIGYGIITSVTVTGDVTFTGNVYTRFAADADMPTFGAGYSIRQPAWSEALGYPAKVLFYQNRLWLANTLALPSSIFGSRINQPVSFDVGTGRDTDAIIYNIGQSNSGDILWLNGGKQLEIYSQNFEFVAPQEQNIALTPSTFSIRQQSAYGSSPEVKPTTYINDSYYVTRTKNAIINFHFTGIGQAYVSSNISLVSQHLVKNPINRALLRGTDVSQDNFIYYLNDDNTITSFQFAAEYKLAALTPFTTIDDVTIQDIVSINNHIYFLKVYEKTGVKALEIMDDSVRMDSYGTYTMASDGTITGLTNYDGYEVQVVFIDPETDNSLNDLGVHLVVGGTVVADNPNEYSGDVQVGFLYEVEVRPMYVFAGTTMYSSGKNETYYFKNYNRIYVDYVDSANFYINGTLVNYQNYQDIQNGVGIVPKTDTAIIAAQTGWDRFGTFSITQSSPFDLQITGIAYQIEAHII